MSAEQRLGSIATNSISSPKPAKNYSYPEPFIHHPSSTHKQTLVLLHGRGGHGKSFGLDLLFSPLSTTGPPDRRATLQTTFPHMKFIFPTAKKRRARWYNRATINQWFDNVPIDEQDDHGMTTDEEAWQLEGLRETREMLKVVVDEEVQRVGAKNVFIGGLSQGCAMSLHFLLSYDGDDALGGFIGMSGWLPFANYVEEILHSAAGGSAGTVLSADSTDPFVPADANPDAPPLPLATQVCNYIRDNMDLPGLTTTPLCLSIPVILGHGIHDERVTVAKGRRAAQILRDLNLDEVEWHEYDEGHWYKEPEQLDDIADALRSWLQR